VVYDTATNHSIGNKFHVIPRQTRVESLSLSLSAVIIYKVLNNAIDFVTFYSSE
jgi:hypothetical protein